MEPPVKRARVGPAPFEDDDPDADELNELPEEVNARRDPAVQLERSRAFAAFKLKSAFERIFEKYEKDFTGVGDEIDLRSGEIVVDNGHIQSLKDAQLGGAADEEEDGTGSGDGASEAGSLNEEERMMRGRAENRLSQLGHHALPPIPSLPVQIGSSPYAGTPWHVPPMLHPTMYPGQMPYGRLHMQYGTPISMPTADPTWSTPELPSSFLEQRLLAEKVEAPIRTKTARLSLSAAREQDVGDEDDILLNPNAVKGFANTAGALATKRKLLLPRPSPVKISVKKKRGWPRKPLTLSEAKVGEPEKALTKQTGSRSTHIGGLFSSHSSRPSPDLDLETGVQEPDTSAATTPTGVSTTAHPTLSTNHLSKGSDGNKGPARSEPLVVGHQQCGWQGDRPDPGDPELYFNLCGGEGKLTRKPRNQILQVQLPARKPPDAGLFDNLTPETSEPSSPRLLRAGSEGIGMSLNPVNIGELALVGKAPTSDRTSDKLGLNQTAMASEVFTRNYVEPMYAFSDDDEPTLPKNTARRRKSSKISEVSNLEHGALRELSQNLDAGLGRRQQLSAMNSPVQKAPESTSLRAQSPTLSLHLDDAVDHSGRVLAPPIAPGSTGNHPDQVGNVLVRGSSSHALADGALKKQLRRRSLASKAEMSIVAEPATKLAAIDASVTKWIDNVGSVSLRGGRSRRSSNVLSKETPTKAPRGRDGGKSNVQHRPVQQEIPQTSPATQPADRLPLAAPSPTPGPPPQDFDTVFSPEENVNVLPSVYPAAPSPTLTDPASKSSARRRSQLVTKQPPPSPATPVKTPSRQRPVARGATESATKTVTATTKRRGILSLLPDNDDEDELSILSPVRPASGSSSAIRSTPASHHVRQNLVAPTGRSGGSNSVSYKLKLRRASVFGPTGNRPATAAGSGGGEDGGARLRTSTKRRARRKSALGGGGSPGVLSAETPVSNRIRSESELVQTPGGTLRRCGEGGFRCERDFCFTCL